MRIEIFDPTLVSFTFFSSSFQDYYDQTDDIGDDNIFDKDPEYFEYQVNYEVFIVLTVCVEFLGQFAQRVSICLPTGHKYECFLYS